MRKVTEIEAHKGFNVWLRFDDGEEGEVDLAALAGRGVFAAWRVRSFFEQVALGPDRGICWPNELELCADSLYLMLTGKQLKPESEAAALHT